MRWRWPLLASLSLLVVVARGQVPPPPPRAPPPARQLAPCQECRLFAASFREGARRTARGKFEGGDAAWEEARLGAYARSEVRLVEIQERLCAELKEHADRCHAVAEVAEPHVEEWWRAAGPDAGDDPFEYVCVEKLKRCCPPRRYGENCAPCRGDPERPCSGNGRCKGDGTRKGNGECACDAGYDGEICERCAPGFYRSYEDEKKTVCSPCHKACEGGCEGAGTTKCTACAPGWKSHPQRGCVDVDECAAPKSPCGRNQFCVNGEGSHECLECDKSCDGCSGDGPDMCSRCAPGHELNSDKLCVNSEGAQKARYVTVTRYLTYLGLCATVCIIFQRSTILAGALGLLVALYISTSEYMLAGDAAGPTPTIDPSQFDFAKLFGS